MLLVCFADSLYCLDVSRFVIHVLVAHYQQMPDEQSAIKGAMNSYNFIG